MTRVGRRPLVPRDILVYAVFGFLLNSAMSDFGWWFFNFNKARRLTLGLNRWFWKCSLTFYFKLIVNKNLKKLHKKITLFWVNRELSKSIGVLVWKIANFKNLYLVKKVLNLFEILTTYCIQPQTYNKVYRSMYTTFNNNIIKYDIY